MWRWKRVSVLSRVDEERFVNGLWPVEGTIGTHAPRSMSRLSLRGEFSTEQGMSGTESSFILAYEYCLTCLVAAIRARVEALNVAGWIDGSSKIERSGSYSRDSIVSIRSIRLLQTSFYFTLLYIVLASFLACLLVLFPVHRASSCHGDGGNYRAKLRGDGTP